MPIKFRCSHCEQFLGISRNKAGSLTDCPTCGRTIRIPDLDGRIVPVPQPALNLQDAALASALDALASIGGEPADRPPAETEGFYAHSPRSQSLAPAPAPLAVVIESPTPLPVAPQRRLQATPTGAAGVDSPAAGDVQQELASLAAVAAKPRSPRAAGRTSSIAFAVAGILAVVLFATGFVTGRLSTPAATLRRPVPGAEERGIAADPAPPANAAVDATPAIRGRVTFQSSDGMNRPDEGARILVFPQTRRGTAKLPVVGFRPGAAPVDAELARASLRTLGGDFTIADADGYYEVRLPTAGQYHVLLISRYQPRDEASTMPMLQRLLNEYFDRPPLLIGQVSHVLRDFRYTGKSTAPLDQTFGRN